MALSGKQRKHLKALAHHRKPVIHVGNAGISAAGADAVQEIGRVAVIYRPAEKPRLKLPE